ncbi:unnamed protein product [Effrenium voratum]|uniref:Glucosidase 2 subunit beta n=1 Tax=Effrenium voratum TaxID=2562239 RepID=A0AA36I1H6_9DINO|nr:unnamed protein product [Effrenium voratum]CAJ1401975.1 unnamed protein product [Effrenium voratum]
MLWWPLHVTWLSRALALTPGISPAEETRYKGTHFVCVEGSATLPASAVNDDFCDCEDGSDEPGTAACAGATDRWFYCPNSGGTARYIYISRVGDGICDCCDGSDEWLRPDSGCRDVCKEQGRARKVRLEQRRAEMQKGILMREAALESMRAEVEEWRKTVAELDANAAPLSKEMLELEEVQRQKRAAVIKEAEQLGREADLVGQGAEKKVSEYAKWMEGGGSGNTAEQAEQVCSGSVCIQRTAVSRKELRQIKVTSGALVDFMEFVYATGSLVVGEGKGDQQEPFNLEPGEVLLELRGGQGGLLDRVQFVTSRGRESKAYGGAGGQNFSFKASEGKMIVGVTRAVGLAGKLTGIQECLFRPLTDAEKAFDEASSILEDARRQLAAKHKETAELREKIEAAAGAHAAYRALNKCGETQIGEYSYKICPFGEATQGHVRLGKWKGWASDASHTALFEGGERCFSGIVRTLRVQFECGEGYVIESVREPSQCVYEATMTHPAACDAQVLTQGDRVLTPHEAHLEL